MNVTELMSYKNEITEIVIEEIIKTCNTRYISVAKLIEKVYSF